VRRDIVAIYTNRYNLPLEITLALSKDRYNPDGEQDIGDFSATVLTSPIQQTILKKRYAANLKTFDYIDNFWAFVGSIAHKVLEEHGTDDSIIEKRFSANILGKKLTGQIDHLKSGWITDYKSTKAYKIMKGTYDDWEKQLNIYAFLAHINGHPVERLRVFAFILDWKKHETYKAGYPECPIVQIPLRLWSLDEQSDYIEERIRLLDFNNDVVDEDLPACTGREMWQDVKDHAILKTGAAKAIKCFDDYDAAHDHWVAKYAGKYEEYHLVTRYTKRTRCLEYCPVAELCAQNKALLEQEKHEDTE
jgi:hypothetical protein